MRRFLSVLLLMAWLPFAWAAEEEKPANPDYVGYIELKPFIANFGGPGKTRFFKMRGDNSGGYRVGAPCCESSHGAYP